MMVASCKRLTRRLLGVFLHDRVSKKKGKKGKVKESSAYIRSKWPIYKARSGLLKRPIRPALISGFCSFKRPWLQPGPVDPGSHNTRNLKVLAFVK